MVNLLPWKDLHDLRDIVDTMYKTSVEIFELKKRAMIDEDEAVATQIGLGKDILSTLSTRTLPLHYHFYRFYCSEGEHGCIK
jgi:hypothetical protein